ncbi:hypothetical protein ACFV1L_15290 [Kitasatospora sp. NPDC059646]|uniref:hypothetical protein n=1 Tax=Kitasatospora sp. NPDC059646 TaxID=3346893 RepID=UPI0036B24489
MQLHILDPDRAAFLEARHKKGSVTVPAWPREDRDLPQTEVPVEWVRFSTLNHRTKAEQLRESRKHGRDDLFTADPLGPEAQEAQFAILRSQGQFDELKADLLDRGQQEPAILTADGVLINGNRRAAGLRALHREGNLKCQYVRCLVLPKDASAEELLYLEAELQVARDFKADYSWVNEALMIEDLYERAQRNWDSVAKRMHRTVADVRRQYDKLQLVHQLVARSGGTRLIVDFTDNESAFDELARHIKNKPAREADVVKEAYFLGILSEVNYRDLRHLQRKDAVDLVAKELAKEPTLRSVLEAAGAAEDEADELDLLSEFAHEDDDESSVADLVDLVASTRPESGVDLPGGGRAQMQHVRQSLRTAITAAAREARDLEQEQNAIDAPLKRLDDAISDLRRIPALLPRARAQVDWDEAAFQLKIREFEALLEDIEGVR